MMFMCANGYDVALCGNTVKNVALSLWPVDHPRSRASHKSFPNCNGYTFRYWCSSRSSDPTQRIFLLTLLNLYLVKLRF